METSVLSDLFKRFADRECRGSSPLYEQLSHRIAADEELLGMLTACKAGQPVPNLLLAAVHFLLILGRQHEVTQYYPSLTEQPRDPSSAFPAFKAFCFLHRNEIVRLLETKLVQTNEVRRCAYLYPAFCHIHRLAGKPLALVEIGTSAGLQLLWDQYRYRYNGADEYYGNPDSDFVIETTIRGANKPFLTRHSPPVASRIGIDLHVNRLQVKEDRVWLKALIWPEHADRRNHFNAAARYFQQHAVQLIEGDGIAYLDLITADREHALCIFHTHVANQLTKEAKKRLFDQIHRLGETRDVFHLYNNMWDAELHLDSYIKGVHASVTLAETDGHGRWFTWKL
ncbi:DUF2332 domain-containing protein [Paenibacillus montanisoli]|uniref:DUF2332 domain-containing protein n=1 Tax=Paenibacillus montanisoli TaxID=2081970 RepID=A0A328U7D7_9BACL|nr:DUF2332 domain-containing protein [Paenibacillus montanisoli]RAP76004.1 DUF2332 domain-containing protein [Paenibacillus montanisoli]